MSTRFEARFDEATRRTVSLDNRYACILDTSEAANQQQTNDAFTEKWDKYSRQEGSKESFYKFQQDWYLSLYGFESEKQLADHLQQFEVILDAGCGLGYKAAWFARLAPKSLVVGMDFSEASEQAARAYSDCENLIFLRGDISNTPFSDGAVGYVSCDQVIMHTEDPEQTFAELARITDRRNGEFACYFYAKKALPRELLDDYFRQQCKEVSNDQLWEMSEQLAELGKRLSELGAAIDVPAIPLLGIREGEMDLQRFVYWNFLKCFWNPDLGRATSVMTNFDWYSPSNARRFTESEVHSIVAENQMRPIFFHREEAAYSGRFMHHDRGVT